MYLNREGRFAYSAISQHNQLVQVNLSRHREILAIKSGVFGKPLGT